MSADPIRLGVVGLGRAFSLMLPTFLSDPRVRLVAACDPRLAAREQFTRDFGGPAFSDPEELARSGDVEALYVASPHQYHADHTRIAAAHGKHVLLEKPMALSLPECDAMIAHCQAAGVHLIVGHCHSFDAPYLLARERIARGDLGQPRMITAINYTDFLYRPRRPEELRTEEGGGVVFSQAAHQVDIVRLLAGAPVTRVRAVTGAWDPQRPTEGAYGLLMWFANGAFANVVYSGYGHFDSDEWNGWIGEMGNLKQAADYGGARRRLRQVASAEEEARLKNESTYGGPGYKPPKPGSAPHHQHFGPMVVSCARGDVRPGPDGVWVYGDDTKERLELPAPEVPRSEVIDELWSALRLGVRPLHDGLWARATLEVCLGILESSRENRDVAFAA